MLKAGALIYAVVVSFIFVLISGSIILLKYQSLFYQEILEQEETLMLNANSGINLLLANWQAFQEGTPKTVDIFKEGSDSVNLMTRQWGLYRVMASEAIHRGKKFEKACISACRPDTTLALYLAQTDDALALCGKTVIKGKCFLPKGGVKRAYIEGQTFQGNKLINGPTEEAQKQLPPVDAYLLEKNLKLLSGIFTENDSVITWDMLPNGNIDNSFLDKTLVITSEVPVSLNGMNIKGNVVIWAKGEVGIESSSVLEDVLICASRVTVADRYSGSVHIVASEEIIIGEECVLNYPSSITILRDKAQETEKTTIKIGEESRLKGALMLYEKQTNFRNPSLVAIDKGVEIEGQVYTTGNFENKGKVHGNVYCKRFYLKTSSSSYGNHLLNAEINVSELSRLYSGIRVEGNSPTEYLVAKWVF